MKKVLFDTSVYGELILDDSTLEKIGTLADDDVMKIYGTKIIRQELRDTPVAERIHGRSKRMKLLQTFDSLVKKEAQMIPVGPVFEALSVEYYRAYRNMGGKHPWSELKADFVIVAVASFKQLDVVVSNDETTFLSARALSAYEKINKENSIINPRFVTYQKYKSELNKLKPYKSGDRRSDL